jgi:hypothetical protein
MERFKKEMKTDNPSLKSIFVRSSKIDQVIIGLSPKTAANWRSQKIGPVYYVSDTGGIFYCIDDLKEYFSRNPIQTSGNEGASRC